MSEIGKRNRNVVIADVNKYDSISRNSIHIINEFNGYKSIDIPYDRYTYDVESQDEGGNVIDRIEGYVKELWVGNSYSDKDLLCNPLEYYDPYLYIYERKIKCFVDGTTTLFCVFSLSGQLYREIRLTREKLISYPTEMIRRMNKEHTLVDEPVFVIPVSDYSKVINMKGYIK